MVLPECFLTDNGREFNNSEFRDIAQYMNSIVKTTAAQGPWSNGLNERHNSILGAMVTKTLEDSHCSMEVALGWSVSAKNSLNNFDGFSANQLIFEYNPNTPSVLINHLPALVAVSTIEVVTGNLMLFMRQEEHLSRTRALKDYRELQEITLG